MPLLTSNVMCNTKISNKGETMKLLVILSALTLTTFLNGCATHAYPYAINGKYYMVGDSGCARYKVLSDTRIMCANSDDKDMGYRNAMSDQELDMYRHNQNMAQQQSQSLSRSNDAQLQRNAEYLRSLGY